MVTKLTYIESDQVNPYKNLAVEEYLLLPVRIKSVFCISGRIRILL